MNFLVANEQGTSRVYSNTAGAVEKRGSAEAIKEEAKEATRNRSHYAKGGDHADTNVKQVHNKEVAVGCERKVVWAIKCSRGACAIRPCAAPTARKGGHCAIGEDKPNAVVAIVPHIDIPTAIHGYTNRAIKRLCACSHAIG